MLMKMQGQSILIINNHDPSNGWRGGGSFKMLRPIYIVSMQAIYVLKC